MFMVLSSWQSHCESSPGSFDECRMAPSSRRPNSHFWFVAFNFVIIRVYFRPLKKDVVLPLAIVKRG